MELLDGLNARQREACEKTQGPVLILAGAGTGKTRTLTHRVAHVVQSGLASSHQVLAVTFTRKAANEMSERIVALIGRDEAAGQLAVTFHALCSMIVRSCAATLGYRDRLSILDPDDSLEVVKDALAEVAGDDLEARGAAGQPRTIRAWISRQKNEGLDPDAVSAAADSDDDLTRLRVQIWRVYQERLRRANAADLDDLLTLALAALRTDVGRAMWVQRFRYVMVDEFQDVNTVQWHLLQALAEEHRNLCVVGDDLQAIYRFRGARVEHILSFEQTWGPGVTVIALEDNYRSTPEILDAANSVIAPSAMALDKRLRATRPSGAAIRMVEFNNPDEEAQAIAERTLRLIGTGASAEAIAIMYRTHRQSRPVEEALRAAGVGYRILDSTEFYKRAEIRTACAYLRLIHNPYDWPAFRRAVTTPRRGVGDKALHHIDAHQARSGVPLTDIAAYPGDVAGLSAPAKRGLAGFDGAFQRAFHEIGEGALSAMLERLCSYLGLQEHLVKQEDGDDWRWQNVLELVRDASRFDRLALVDALPAFLEHVALQLSPAPEDENAEKVTLLTLHSAKGLEWPHAMLTGLEEATFRLEGMYDGVPEHDEEIEEARRLLYVGITRAQDTLTLSYSASRYNRFRGGTNYDEIGGHDQYPPLRFLVDLPANVDRATRVQHAVLPAGRGRREEWQPARRRGFEIGQRVRHALFGYGTVERAVGPRVTVRFDDSDQKQLLAGSVRAA